MPGKARTIRAVSYRPGQPIVVHHLKPWKRGRPIQMQGWVRAFDGETLVVARRFGSPGTKYDGLDARQAPGDRGLIEVRAGAWIARRLYLRRSGRMIGELYNVQTPTELAAGAVRYVDLEVDVARQPRRGVEVQDLAKLEAAVRGGHVPVEVAELAQGLAEALAARLRAAGDGPADWDVRPDAARIGPSAAAFLERATVAD